MEKKRDDESCHVKAEFVAETKFFIFKTSS